MFFTALTYTETVDKSLLACSRMVKTVFCGLTVLFLMRRL